MIAMAFRADLHTKSPLQADTALVFDARAARLERIETILAERGC